MIAAQFELLKCGHELLSSPFRVTVHGGKGPVILLSLPHRELPSSSRFPPNGGTAPCESPANTVRATAPHSWKQNYGEQRVKASHGLRQVRKRPCYAFTVREAFKKFTLGQVIMSSGSTVGPKCMTGWSTWCKQEDKSKTGYLVKRSWWAWCVKTQKKTIETAALQSGENQKWLMKDRIRKAGGDLAGGREAENQ